MKPELTALIIATAAALLSKGDGHHYRSSQENDYTNCCGIDKSTIDPSIHSACQAPGSDFVSPIPVDKDLLLQIHQNCRASVDPPAKHMADLVWDDTLACVAQQYAAQCSNEHDSYKERAYPTVYSIGVGQNLGYGSGAFQDLSFQDIAEGWCSEKSNWEYGTGAIFDDPENQPIGHYTQIVWDKTTAFGCGAAQCKEEDKRVFICNYGPAGNVKINGVDPKKNPYEKRP